MQINNETLRAFRSALMDTVKPLEEKYGVKIDGKYYLFQRLFPLQSECSEYVQYSFTKTGMHDHSLLLQKYC